MLACTTHPRRAGHGGEVGRQSKGHGSPARPSACATGARVGAGLSLMAGMAAVPAGSISPPAPHSGLTAAHGWRSVGCWRDPSGEKEPQAFLCTDQQAAPVDILRWFVRRWRIETTFEEARRHLGMETQRQWSDLAILRTTPALLALFSLVTLWASQLAVERGPVLECVRWYPKPLPTFSDALALVRRELWTTQISATSPSTGTSLNASAALISRLLLVVCRPP